MATHPDVSFRRFLRGIGGVFVDIGSCLRNAKLHVNYKTACWIRGWTTSFSHLIAALIVNNYGPNQYFALPFLFIGIVWMVYNFWRDWYLD